MQSSEKVLYDTVVENVILVRKHEPANFESACFR